MPNRRDTYDGAGLNYSSQSFRGQSNSQHSSRHMFPRTPPWYQTCASRAVGIIEGIIDHRAWRLLATFFTIVLLFGTQIQQLLLTTTTATNDIVFIITFLFFVLEICFRLACKSNYFQCNLANGIGSYIFWCDFISTGMILYDISYINPDHFQSPSIHIRLGLDGVPTSGFTKITRFEPVELERDLLVIIFRTLRVARYVRSHTVVKRSSMFDFFWIFRNSHLLNPVWHICQWRRNRQQKRRRDSALDDDTNPSNTMMSGNDFNMEFSSDHVSEHSRSRLPRTRVTWRTTQLHLLSLVKCEREASTLQWMLRAVGLVPSKKVQIQRHIAAMQIQRSFRRYNRSRRRAARSQEDDDEWGASWNGRSRQMRNGTATVTTAATSTRNGATMQRESQIGSDMRDLTGQRVAIGIVLALMFTVLFTYSEEESSRLNAMVVLHKQTQHTAFQHQALQAAKRTSAHDLFWYQLQNETVLEFDDVREKGASIDDLRDREKLIITVSDTDDKQTKGQFAYRSERVHSAWAEISATLFVLLLWFLGVTAFAGPVMSLVVTPIERMVRLLGMLMLDPLGYQSTSRFKRFLAEEDTLIRNTRWTKEVLRGMETSFLMSTILRIGSLMKVGFGSAGVEIIRKNLQKGSDTMLNLTEQGTTVSCIFLFCDIRQFTDATECLQEEVFVFTNKIAAVVHSFCHAFGGSANKNVGDAFLVSWILDDGSNAEAGRNNSGRIARAKNFQADKALFSVIKICISLHHDKYYIETMSEAARERLLNKLSKRPGPVVQMGFGIHAGKAVQGAIGSQRKIDATYVSEAVERSEFLESSTKKYGVKMLMSDSFHELLHPKTRQKCRMVDKVMLLDDDEDVDADDGYLGEPSGDRMDLFTFDMDIDALFRTPFRRPGTGSDVHSDTDSIRDGSITLQGKRLNRRPQTSARGMRRRRSMIQKVNPSEELASNGGDGPTSHHGHHAGTSVSSNVSEAGDFNNANNGAGMAELRLPTGPLPYNLNSWHRSDMKRIRDRYVHGLFFHKFDQGLQAYYNRDWDNAAVCFQHILDTFEDGPSKYFVAQIKKHDGKPPRDFRPYSIP